MSDKTVLGVFLLATIIAAGGTAWATSTPAQDSSPQQSAATKAFGKLSADSSRAFQDLTLTRLAIYDGRIDQAKTLVGDAKAAFAKAQNDESVFTKDETKLMSATQMSAKAAAKSADAKAADAKSADAKTAAAPQDTPATQKTTATPVAWLPVDGAISLDENYALSPTKKQAVAEANKSLAKGDRAGAMDKLKLADVDMTVALEVVPIKQTISDVDQAAQMIDSGKYYEGSQMLRKVQMAARYDVTDILGTPKTAVQ